jgi:glutaredoxin 2
MALGYLDLPYQSIVLPYDDEATPVNLTGVKMLPIIEVDGKIHNESLEIMALLDLEQKLPLPQNLPQEFTELLNKLGSNVHSLAMPYWIYTPEFNETSRKYFQKKKEEKRGPFHQLVKNRQLFEAPLLRDLSNLINELKPFYRSAEFSGYDVLIAAHLWGLYVVPEFQFPAEIHRYLQEIKRVCNFNYHRDFWSVHESNS